jgi:hypothetical protein
VSPLAAETDVTTRRDLRRPNGAYVLLRFTDPTDAVNFRYEAHDLIRPRHGTVRVVNDDVFDAVLTVVDAYNEKARDSDVSERRRRDGEDLDAFMRRTHLEDNPGCTFGDEPHYVPPSFGQVGFYACDPPADLTNHTRCRSPYDHDHAEHQADATRPRGVTRGGHAVTGGEEPR